MPTYFYSSPCTTGKEKLVPGAVEIPFLFVPVHDGEVTFGPAAICYHISIRPRARRGRHRGDTLVDALRFLFVPVHDGEGQIYAYCTNICPLYWSIKPLFCTVCICLSCYRHDTGMFFGCELWVLRSVYLRPPDVLKKSGGRRFAEHVVLV